MTVKIFKEIYFLFIRIRVKKDHNLHKTLQDGLLRELLEKVLEIHGKFNEKYKKNFIIIFFI